MAEYINRYLEAPVIDDVRRKMVFIGGPRQTGKTTLAKSLCKNAGCDIQTRYLNWDAPGDRENIIKESFPSGEGFLILDEIHKYSRWRQVVKGLFDKRGDELQILVTGSARLDYYRARTNVRYYNVVGNLCLVYGVFILLLVFIPNEPSGRLIISCCGAIITGTGLTLKVPGMLSQEKGMQEASHDTAQWSG